MADLDTRSKRASSVQILAPFILAPVLPDGTIGQADRQHIAWTYAGILASVFIPQIYTANVYVNITPTGNLLANPSASANIDAQPSATEEVYSG